MWRGGSTIFGKEIGLWGMTATHHQGFCFLQKTALSRFVVSVFISSSANFLTKINLFKRILVFISADFQVYLKIYDKEDT